MPRLYRSVVIFTGIFALTLLGGCKTSEKELQAQELYKTKKAHYESLYETLSEKKIEKGTTTAEIREQYGEPDDTYSAGGSTSGRLEIWTYGKKVLSDKIDIWRPIRLYFNDSKLIDWTF